MRGMVMVGLLVAVVTPPAWGQDWLPPRVMERVNQASRIRLVLGAELLEMRSPRVEGDALSGVLRVPKEAPRILGMPITGKGGQSVDWRRSVDTLIPVDRVLSLEVKDGHHWRRGAWIGAGVGAAVGVLFSFVPEAMFECFGGCRPEDRPSSLLPRLVPATAVIGLAIGTVLGSLSPRWAMIYRRGEVPLPAITW